MCVIASGGWNITAGEHEASGLLEGLGLEIIAPSNSTYTCTSSAKGTLIDYVRVTKGHRAIAQSCEVVKAVPCATILGFVRPGSARLLSYVCPPCVGPKG